MDVVVLFLERTREDARISSVNISLYVSLWKNWIDQNKQEPLRIKRKEVMTACKITGLTTYHKTIRELARYGYIGYDPSYSRHEGSRVYFTMEGINKCRAMQQHT